MSDRYYASQGKARRSPLSADGQSGGLFTGQGGRPVLPPISSGFPTSRSPAPSQYTGQYPQQRSSVGRGEYNAAQYAHQHQQHAHQWSSHQPSQQHASAFYYEAHDPRFSTANSAHAPYTSSRTSPSPPNESHDPRRLPPISVSPTGRREEGWQASSYAPASTHMQYSDEIHSPTASYPSQYPSYQVPQQESYNYHRMATDNGNIPFSGSSYNQQQHNPMGMHNPTERVAMPRKDSHPYTRYSGTPQSLGYSTGPEVAAAPVEEPVKKKRKRADAAQLKVLNETYQRTAFPSTEERQSLATELDMPPRSVQIWFQNKRQSDRQSSRQPANTSSSRQPFSDSISDEPPVGSYGSSSSLSPTNASGPMYLPRSSRDASHHRTRSPEESGDPRKWTSRRY